MALFIIGLFIGCTIGIFAAALCRAASLGEHDRIEGDSGNEHR